jgi:predicted nicotinamide N-methyase
VDSSSSSSSRPRLRAQVFDWHATQLQEKFDVVVACDVLYEESAVEPVAEVVSRLLKPTSGLLLLADPPNRTAQHRQRCIQLLAEAKPAGLQLQECGIVACDVAKLDAEMRGGVERESVPVQFMVFRRALGNDTVGIKLDLE